MALGQIKIWSAALSAVFALMILGYVPAEAQSLPQAFQFQGDLTDLTGNIVTSNAVVLTFGVYDPTATCLLYEETQTLDLSQTYGKFNVTVGSAPGNAKRSLNDPNLSLNQIFANSPSAIRASGAAHCTPGYTPVVGDARKLQVTVVSISGTAANDILSAQTITPVPYATYADSLQGKAATDLLQVNTTTAAVTQSNVESIFASSTAVTKLLALISGTSAQYMTNAANGSAPVPSFPSAPASPAAGNFWYNSTSNTLQYYNGTSTQSLAAGGGITSLSSDVTATGPGAVAAIVNSVGGSTAANVHAAELLANGATSANTVSTIVKRDSLGNFLAGTALLNTANLSSVVYKDSGSNSVTVQAPTTVSTSYILKWPTAIGTLNQVLTTDASGNLSWTTPGSAPVTSVSVAAPITNLGTAAAPNISLARATAAVDGYLGMADFMTFNNKLGTSSTFSGDVSGTSSTMSVDKIKGKTVTAPTLAGQVLRYDGTNITPNFVSMQDLRSNVTGSVALASSCSAAQTLTYNSIGDNLTCSNIAISNAAVSGLGTAATLNVGTGANNIVQLNGLAQLPVVDGSLLTNLNAINISSGTLGVARLPASVVLNGGNSFGAISNIGNNDNFDLNVKTNNAVRMTVQAGGNVGIGTTAPAAQLDVQSAITATTSGNGASFFLNVNPSGATSSTYYEGLSSKAGTGSTNVGSTDTLMALHGDASFTGSSTGPTIMGTQGSAILNSSTGSLTKAVGVYGTVGNMTTGGTISNGYGVFSSLNPTTSNTITNGYGLYVDTFGTGVTNKYGVYVNDPSAKNYFAGNVGIGTTTPAFALDVMGPIRVGAAGAAPMMGNYRLGSQPGPPSVLASSSVSSTFTITSAAVGDSVVCNPRGPLPVAVSYYCYVSGANLISLVLNNNSTSAVSIATTWDILLIR